MHALLKIHALFVALVKHAIQDHVPGEAHAHQVAHTLAVQIVVIMLRIGVIPEGIVLVLIIVRIHV